MLDEKALLEKLDSVLKMNEALVAENSQQKALIQSLSNPSSRNVEVGCNAIAGITLLSPNNEIEVDIKYGDTIALAEEDIRALLKRNSTRKLFVSGVVFFVDEDQYSKFSIKRRENINSDSIVKVFKTKDAGKLVKFYDRATSKKYDVDVMNILFYKIIDMNINHELGDFPYELRSATEEYFGMKMDMAEKLYRRVKNIL